MKIDLLHSLLVDVRDRGCERIEKKKLLWMLGRKNESAAVWSILLREWEEVAPDMNLYGGEWGAYIMLSATALQNVADEWVAD